MRRHHEQEVEQDIDQVIDQVIEQEAPEYVEDLNDLVYSHLAYQVWDVPAVAFQRVVRDTLREYGVVSPILDDFTSYPVQNTVDVWLVIKDGEVLSFEADQPSADRATYEHAVLSIGQRETGDITYSARVLNAMADYRSVGHTMALSDIARILYERNQDHWFLTAVWTFMVLTRANDLASGR